MASIIQTRRDTAANWTATNPILADGEQGYESDTAFSKFGDGVSTWTALTYFKGYGDHDDLVNNGGAGSHATITAHIADGTLHFTQASISITESQVSDLQSYLLNITAESVGDLIDVTAAVPTLRDVLVYGGSPATYESRALVEADISDLGTYLTAEVNDLSTSVTWVNVPDANITQTSVTQHQAALSITESQISDLQSYLLNITTEAVGDLIDVTVLTPADKHVLVYDGITDNKFENRLLVEADISDLGTYLTAEVNDLSSAVTWVNVPDANITQTSVTQHQAALSITESQISDLQSYLLNITAESVGDLSDVTAVTPIIGEVLVYGGSPATYESRALVEADISDLGTYLTNITGEPIGDLSDVVFASLATGDTLSYTGTTWVNTVPDTVITSHTGLTDIGTNTHAQIDTHIADTTLHFTQASISITESQISDLGTYANKASTINTQTGTTYTLVLTDADTKIVEMNNAAANTLIVPLNASVAFPTGTKIDIVQYGAGVTTIEGEGSPPVTIRTAETLVLDGIYSGATLYKRATDEWVLIGRLVAA